jgi:hypothetical protein
MALGDAGSAANLQRAAYFSSRAKPLAANGSEAVKVATFQTPVPGFGDPPGPELE